MKKVLLRCMLFALSFIILTGFTCGSSTAPGFKVHIEEIIQDDLGITLLGGISGIQVTTNHIQDLPNRTIRGTVLRLQDITNNDGNVSVIDARVPAVWEVTWADQNHCSNLGVLETEMPLKTETQFLTFV